ncbi:MAG: ribonuclease R [Alphaproteobacteria bacterium]|nr:ribonuclease R [Alphaproteobacteria bacterium]
MKKQTKHQTVPSMEEVLDYLKAQSTPVTKRDVARAFHIKGNDRIHLKKILKDLKEKNEIQGGSGGRKIGITDALPERVVVEITGLDSMGDLLARPLEWPADKAMPQITITADKLVPPAGVGDVVQVSVKPIGNKLYEGVTLRRMTAGENHMVGIYEDGYVHSVDRRLSRDFELIQVPPSVKLQNKDIVVADIPMVRDRNPKATFIKKIGNFSEAFAPTLIAIYQHSLPVAFTEAAEKQAQHLTIPPVDKEHEDLRAIPFVTIDGADARDFDDAVWAEETTEGFHVMVGIADVAWYVRPGSALDMDARLRGNSTYFPDRVLPMLPFELSNGVCSLNPNETRAAMVCEVWLNKQGKKLRHVFRRALIKSVRRLTYPEVQAALDGRTPIVGLEQEIDVLHKVYRVLAKQRSNRGVLELDVPERQVVLDLKGKVKAIKVRESLDSMKLIEELMILANVSAAETLEAADVPTMYRVHDRPSEEKRERLNAFLTSLHYKAIGDDARPKDFNEILLRADGTKQDYAINEFVLRSQSQAEYSPDNIGHFGLALSHYAHFTSPIRRYADVLVHRALIKALHLGAGALTSEEADTFSNIAEHISATERQSAAAEMDAVDRYTASFLSGREGEAFTGRISSVTAFGLFVAIDEYGADGFIPFRLMTGDYYEYDDEAQQLVGRGSGKIYRMGDEIRVVLMECEPETGGLLFKPLTKKMSFSSKKKRNKKSRE